MIEQEKYLEGHRNCGIKVGDRVRVIRKAEDFESGWQNIWFEQEREDEEDMNVAIGLELFVIEDNGEEGFSCGQKGTVDNFMYPYFVLEKI